MDTLIQSAFNRAFGSENNKSVVSPGTQGRIENMNGIDWEAKVSEEFDIQMHKAKIMVVGCGGAGCNTVSRLTEIGASGSDIITLMGVLLVALGSVLLGIVAGVYIF